jgi:hypothetical protein
MSFKNPNRLKKKKQVDKKITSPTKRDTDIAPAKKPKKK